MIAFADGAADVLVCTTIIESGLDIPNANTIIIDRADTLGLAQLYQLRGRVGRSARRAYAYLLYRRRERLSDEARKRLQAIFNASELGAGFQIALSDLEIRGAGNILGGEQSGHMAAVGFDLYSRMLAEAVEEQKASARGPRARSSRRRRRSSTCRSTPTCPTTTSPTRPRSSSCTGGWRGPGSAGDLAAFRQEVTDRFGPMPAAGRAPRRGRRAAAGGRGGRRRRRSRARRAGWSSASGRRSRARWRCASSAMAACPASKPSDVTFASNQVRIRVPPQPGKAWQLTQAVVARLSSPMEAA